MPRSSLPIPPVRTISLVQPMTWLVYAWRDMARAGWVSFAHGLALALAGAAIFAVAHNRFWLLAGALSGFLVVAPVLATSFYALSRALERGEPAKGVVIEEKVAGRGWQLAEEIDFKQLATLPDLVSGRVDGRKSDAEVTCFINNIGLGFQFAAAGALVYRKAKETGLGHDVPTD